MVHPYLRRRDGLEPEQYPSDAVREVLKRSFGVPIFRCQQLGEGARFTRHDLEALAAAGALAALEGHRHLAFWQVAGFLPPVPAAQDAVREPALALLRDRLDEARVPP